MAINEVWFKKNNGIWNNDPSANPATGIGGVALTPINGVYYITGFVDNQAITFNFGGSGFTYLPPSGFTGVPNVHAGFTTFDPASIFQGAGLSGNGLVLGSGSAFGAATTWVNDAVSNGSYYYEATWGGQDIFTNTSGTGILRTGADLTYSPVGGYNFSDINGGVVANMGSILTGHNVGVLSSTVAILDGIFILGSNDILSVAFTLSPNILPGVSADAQAGSFTTVIEDGISLSMSDFIAIGYIQPPDDRNITLLYSDDGGGSWSDSLVKTAGAQGKFKTNVQYWNLGESRIRIFKVRTGYSGPLLGVYVSFIVSNT